MFAPGPTSPPPPPDMERAAARLCVPDLIKIASLHFRSARRSDASTLKSNRGAKQSLKQAPRKRWLFYLPPWLRYGAIKALPSAHPLVR